MPRIFVSYSHSDRRWLDDLVVYLAPLVRATPVEVWHDRQVRAGEPWSERITQALETADIAILLVSPGFLASRFIADNELPPLLDAASRNKTRIFWIPVRQSDFENSDIVRYQAAHDPRHPLASLTVPKRDEAWKAIVNQLRAALNVEVVPRSPEPAPSPKRETKPEIPGELINADTDPEASGEQPVVADMDAGASGAHLPYADKEPEVRGEQPGNADNQPEASGRERGDKEEEPRADDGLRRPLILLLAACAVGLLVLAVLAKALEPDVPKVPVHAVAVAIDGRGLIYVAEPATHQVRVVHSDGTVLPFAGIRNNAGVGGEQVSAQRASLNAPSGVAVGMDGTVYIADTGNHRVRKVKDGVVETVPGTAGISEPFGLTVGPNGDLYVTDKATHRVLRVRSDGTLMVVAGDGTSGPAGLNFPHGIAADSNVLYIADRNNQVVREVALNGGPLETLAGTGRDAGPSRDGDLAAKAALSLPIAVAAANGDVFIVENGSKRIRRVGPDRTIATLDTGKFRLSSPTGIAVDAGGVVYVADSDRLLQIAGSKAKVIATREPR